MVHPTRSDPRRTDTRERIAAAAFDLFEEQGYESTSVDSIAERAGLARRTLFRHFPVKEDLIFPDHEYTLRQIGAHLENSSGLSPKLAVSRAARIVLDRYLGEGELALRRYRLTKSVTALRDREIATVYRYQRVFARYLAERLGEGEPSRLIAELTAASVVAAHNTVLRGWLREDYPAAEAVRRLDDALEVVARMTGPKLAGAGSAGSSAGFSSEQAGTGSPESIVEPGTESIVVAVFRSNATPRQVMDRLRASDDHKAGRHDTGLEALA